MVGGQMMGWSIDNRLYLIGVAYRATRWVRAAELAHSTGWKPDDDYRWISLQLGTAVWSGKCRQKG